MTRFKSTFILSAILISSLAHAYIPPSAFLVKGWAKKHDAKVVRVRTTLISPSGSVRLKVTTYVQYPSRTLTSWATDSHDHELIRVIRQAADYSVLDSLFFDSSATSLIDALKQAGIPIKKDEELLQLPTEEERRATEVESLKRWKNKVVWAIGNTGPHGPEDSPQLWMEKDSFLPLRIVFDSKSGRRLEAQIEDYKVQRDFSYPKSWGLVQPEKADGTFLLREELVDLSTGSEVTKSAEFRSLESSKIGYTDWGNSVPAEIRELLDKFYGDALGRIR